MHILGSGLTLTLGQPPPRRHDTSEHDLGAGAAEVLRRSHSARWRRPGRRHRNSLALLGPNGAGQDHDGERCFSTLIGADDEIRVAGHDVVREPDAILAAIGVKGQFSAADNLHPGEETCGRWPTYTT